MLVQHHPTLLHATCWKLEDVGFSLNLLKISSNIHRPTLLNTTCWVRLNTMLENVDLSLNLLKFSSNGLIIVLRPVHCITACSLYYGLFKRTQHVGSTSSKIVAYNMLGSFKYQHQNVIKIRKASSFLQRFV